MLDRSKRHSIRWKAGTSFLVLLFVEIVQGIGREFVLLCQRQLLFVSLFSGFLSRHVVAEQKMWCCSFWLIRFYARPCTLRETPIRLKYFKMIRGRGRGVKF